MLALIQNAAPKVVARREVTRVESKGVVIVKVNTVLRNMKQLGYSVPTPQPAVVAPQLW